MREYNWFYLEIVCVLSQSFGGWVFGGFLLDSRSLNKISKAFALCLPTSKAIGNLRYFDC
jgi:hypothetical protein